LSFKLSIIEKFISRRRQLARLYFKKLKSTDLILPKLNGYSDHVYHLFTVYHPKREKIIKELRKNFIETKIIYPYPIHKMKPYKVFFKNQKRLKNSEIKAKGIFCLPIYPELKNSEVIKICEKIKKILKVD